MEWCLNCVFENTVWGLIYNCPVKEFPFSRWAGEGARRADVGGQAKNGKKVNSPSP